MPNFSNLELCKVSSSSYYSETRKLAQDELNKRGVDWRGFECSNAISQAKLASKKTENQTVRCFKDAVGNYNCN